MSLDDDLPVVLHAPQPESTTETSATSPLLAGLRPVTDAVETLHEGDDGYVAINRKEGAEFEHIAAVPGTRIGTFLGHNQHHLIYDSFYSINSFYRASGVSPFQPDHKRRTRYPNTLRRLCAAFADLDCYKAGLSAAQGAEKAILLQQDGRIPPPTYLASSGKGLWLFWQLRDGNNLSVPQRAWPEKVKWYARIQEELRVRLVELGSDASDAMRLTRIPGSVNTKSFKRVIYYGNYDHSGHLPRYTLEDLGILLDVPAKKAESSSHVGRANVHRAARRKGYFSMIRRRLANLEQLHQMRGGFSDGCRNHAVLFYAHTLVASGLPPDEIEARVARFAEGCQPSLEPEQAGAIVRGALKRNRPFRFRNQTIADRLDVTPEEASLLQGLPCAPRFQQQQLQPMTRAEMTRHRRQLVGMIVSDHGAAGLPSLRRMQGLLRERGISPSLETVRSDYRALGLDLVRRSVQKTAVQ